MNSRTTQIETVLVNAVQKLKEIGDAFSTMHEGTKRQSVAGFISQLGDDEKAALGQHAERRLLNQRSELEALYRMRGQRVPDAGELNKRALAMVMYDQTNQRAQNNLNSKRAKRRSGVSNRPTGRRAPEQKESAEQMLDRIWK
jgi:hypothetical protein